MTPSALTVANYFLDKASQEARALTPMQLIKLVYIAHGWHLGYFSRPLFNESVEAWKFGPVIDSVYQRTRRFGSSAVVGMLPGASPHNGAFDENVRSLLDSVWDAYKGFGGLQLSAMTHKKGTPWDVAWNEKGGKGQYHAEIENSDIESHYKAKIREHQA